MSRQSYNRKFIKIITVSAFCLLLFIFLLLHNNLTSSSKQHQRMSEGSQEDVRREFNEIPKQSHHSGMSGSHEKMFGVAPAEHEATKHELAEAKLRLAQLEKKIAILEGRIPQKFPDVEYLGYKDRKRIIVTGGAGFVGSHLVDVLMTQGHEVIVVDNFFTGRKRNLQHWFGHHNFELIHHDIVNPLYVEADEIYHLASPASPPHYMQNPVKTIKTNTLGTINMLGLARRVGARILIASTSEVYGDPMVHPQPESYWGHVNPIGPRACYDEGKRVAETLAYSYAKQENVSVRVARIFNTYGPRMHVSDGRVVSNFIMQALQNLTITVYGNGKQTRSFCYISDLVDGLLSLMASSYSLPVNIGNPVEHTIEEFALIIKNLVPGCRSTVSTSAAVEDDPQRRRPDIAVAEEHLHWSPKISLQDGLQKTIDYFKEELARKTFSINQTYMDVKVKSPQHSGPLNPLPV